MSADTLEMMFREFCLPTMAARFAEMMQSAEAQNWGYRKLLLQLCEAEAGRPAGAQARTAVAGVGPALG